jgi:hypothetical protein
MCPGYPVSFLLQPADELLSAGIQGLLPNELKAKMYFAA